MTNTFNIETFRFIAYYYASRSGAYLEVQQPGSGVVVKTIQVKGKRAARKLCTENNYRPWNF